MPNDPIADIFEDDKGAIWIGYRTKGLVKWKNGNILNPGHHDGVFYMCSSVVEEFKDCDYILHFHADNFLREGWLKYLGLNYQLFKETIFVF